jgi:four helix bundle protein
MVYFWRMGSSTLRDKSYNFAIKVVLLAKFLFEYRREYVLGRQLLRSGTSIGASIREAEFAQSRPDFLSKMYIALKEANETAYWLCLLKDSGAISQEHFEEHHQPCKELIAMLAATVKTLKSNK